MFITVIPYNLKTENDKFLHIQNFCYKESQTSNKMNFGHIYF